MKSNLPPTRISFYCVEKNVNLSFLTSKANNENWFLVTITCHKHVLHFFIVKIHVFFQCFLRYFRSTIASCNYKEVAQDKGQEGSIMQCNCTLGLKVSKIAVGYVVPWEL